MWGLSNVHIKLNCHGPGMPRAHSATLYLQARNASPLASYDLGHPLGSLTSDTGGSQAQNIEYNGDTHPMYFESCQHLDALGL